MGFHRRRIFVHGYQDGGLERLFVFKAGGLCVWRKNNRQLNAAVFDFHAQRIGKAANREFRGSIGSIGIHAQKTSDRGDIYDVT